MFEKEEVEKEKDEEIFKKKNDKGQPIGNVQTPELIELLKKGELYAW